MRTQQERAMPEARPTATLAQFTIPPLKSPHSAPTIRARTVGRPAPSLSKGPKLPPPLDLRTWIDRLTAAVIPFLEDPPAGGPQMHGAFGPIRDRLMQVLARKAETWTEGERREFQRMWPGYVFLWRRGQLPEWDRAHHRVRSFPMSFGLDPWWLLVEQWQTGRTPDQPFLDPLPQLLQVPCPSPWPDTIPPVYLLASTTVCAHCIPEDPVPVWSLIAPDQWPVHQIAVWQQYGVAQWVRDHGGCSFPHASPYRFQRDLLIGRFLWVQWALAHDEGGI